MISYYLERSGGKWSGRWYSSDEGKTYHKTWVSPGQCEEWCKLNEFKFVLVS